MAWFGSLPGEVSLDLFDADVSDAVSVVEELVSFWFFQDENSGGVPPSVAGTTCDTAGARSCPSGASDRTDTAVPPNDADGAIGLFWGGEEHGAQICQPCC